MARQTSAGSDRRLDQIFTPELSRAVRIARVMCITLMMTVHVWPGLTAITTADVPLALHWFYVLLIKEFGLASVPLLSVVSGVLFYRSMRSGSYGDLMISKVRTLLVPMVIWSVLLLIMFIAKSAATQDHAFFDVPAMEWVNRVFAITAPPINHPLGFLRDIFVCCLIGVAVARMERLQPWSGRALIVAIAAVEILTDGILMLRPQVLLFFGIGLFVAMMPPRSLVLPWLVVGAVAVSDLLVQHGPFDLKAAWKDQTDLLHRFAVAMLMWRMAVSIARSEGRFGTVLERLEPVIFLVFCSHMLTISVLAVLFSGLGLWVTSPVYPLVFVLQIPVVIAVALLLDHLGELYAPRLLAVMSARRFVPVGQPVPEPQVPGQMAVQGKSP
jgi:hypothetical protein